MDWKMDWDLAIKRNSEALKGIIAALFAMLGLDGDATVSRISALHRAVLRVLRPAESAVRRLIVIAARGLVVKVAPSRPMPKGLKIGKGSTPSSLLPALRYAERLPGAAPAPRKIREASAAHPFLRTWFPVGLLWSCPNPLLLPPAARWPGQCRTHHPQAPGPQVRP